MERRVVDRVTLINKLNSMTSKEISEAQLRFIFTNMSYIVKIEEENQEEEK